MISDEFINTGRPQCTDCGHAHHPGRRCNKNSGILFFRDGNNRLKIKFFEHCKCDSSSGIIVMMNLDGVKSLAFNPNL
jgi:hypothetical protein